MAAPLTSTLNGNPAAASRSGTGVVIEGESEPGGGIRRSRAPRRIVLILLLAWTVPLSAQEGEVAGVVLGRSLQPLAGAQVTVQGTDLGALTDSSGRFRIQGLTGSRVTLRVVLIGYRDAEAEVAVGEVEVRVTLEESAVPLDRIVVTGTPGGTQRRAIGNAVSQVSVSEVMEIAPPPDIQSVLSAHVPGLRIMRASGQIGAGGSTRIRGLSSISLSNEPLIYMDGARIDNAAAVESAAFTQGDQPSRINDIDPDDIESIEVIKGPAAATLYGTEASNGVIQIITKRGGQGPPRFDYTVKQGASFLRNPTQVFPRTWYLDDEGNLQSYHLVEKDIAEGFGSPFQTGHTQGYGMDVSGGTESIRYYAAVGWDRDEGILSYNWQNRFSTRANLTYLHSDQLEFSTSLGFQRNRTRSASATQSMTVEMIWAGGHSLDTPLRGWLGNVPEAFEDVEGYEDVDRFTGSFQAIHRPSSWLTQRLTFGMDVGNTRGSRLFPRDPLGSEGPFGTNSLGFKEVTGRRSLLATIDYGTTASFDLSSGWSTATSAGVQYYQRETQSSDSWGREFPVPGLETISAATQQGGGEDFVENKTFGVYIQQQFGWNNRRFLTAAIRGDDNSAFGENFEFVVYPKLSGTWVVSEEEFFAIPGINDFKLRAAWGKAGNQPDVFAASRLYNPSVGRDGAPIVTPGNIGNPDLKPEVGTELELGFDASLLGERVAVEFTHSRRTTTDAIVSTPVAPSSGFLGDRFVNIGEIRAWASELSLNAGLIRRENLALDLGINVSHNANEIISLGDQTLGAFSIGGIQRHVEGFPIGSIFNQRILSAEFDADGNVTNRMCEGGDPLSGGGPAGPCDEAGTAYWGQPVPTREGSVSMTLTLWNNLRAFALVDYVGGHVRHDDDLGASHTFFNNSRAAVLRDDPLLEAIRYYDEAFGIQSGLSKGDFAKLRNVSLSYTLPDAWSSRFGASRTALTLSAENVATLWVASKGTFGRRHTDPEIRNNADDGLNVSNQEKLPPFTRILMSLRVSM